MTPDFDICIIGAGVIGLALARQLSRRYSVLILEQADLIGSETSSRNSEVIHAGLYYPPGSLKETLCLRGRALTYQFCQQFDIPHQKIGKLIVSPTNDHPELQRLEHTAQRLAIPLQRLDRHQLHQMEPDVAAAAALWSPETGIIDSHRFMQALQHQAEQAGALLVCRSQMTSAHNHGDAWAVTINTSDGPTTIHCQTLINAAGLEAVALMATIDAGTNTADTNSDARLHNGSQTAERNNTPPVLFPARGHYFSYQGKSPFRHLVYPLPEPGLAGLGVHATLDLAGQLRFGPDVEYLDPQAASSPERYHVSEHLRRPFAAAIRRYWPALDENQLQAAYAGIRPKLSAPGNTAADFVFQRSGPATSPAWHLLGIESPGLTSALAIAEHVEQLLETR
ncbi:MULTISPECIES: NAD(P)/FAD-dependent oxidoreductase [unclassified Oceanobacter]|jgi:L-2-hydroxyglutarate oxidase LhgO|uniref:NAD(P)/FAD-dependent oxidoreductase n=1 Tax=unclassified Oceanobacter TaxID=2620260 RepID=UPI00273513CC|nr:MULTISPECIES: NAD(P)/FAD-dependent oxidoreductase [unclassified Oceanobacter]MDP2609420.1 NAD(P)/FAD-dependent oxidoreductase [Oceanobacter sp. 1_MG-2023]MDP2612880.1 NAD(P)/FAD-dependent oxidoreductase [Oceanobacter sp. 2_MG-2023]